MVGALLLAALPVSVGLWLGFGPPAWLWAAVGGALLALAAWRRAGWLPGPGLAVLALLLGTVASVGAGLLWSLAAPAVPPPHEQRRNYVLDLDSRVAPQPFPRCRGRAAHVEVLLERGAHPRLDGTGRVLFFDAVGPQGRRQIHRLERDSGELACLTCGEPGNNRRPHAAAGGRGLVFDTDRHASALDPLGTDLHVTGQRAAPEVPSRRVTFDPGPDDHGVFDAAGAVLAWSRGERGRFAVVAASLRRGHGALAVERPARLHQAGSRWVAPIAWSPTGRTLAIAEGHPLAPARVHLFDPATGELATLPDRLHPEAGASFSADGDQLAQAAVGAAGVSARLPGALGFAIARVSEWSGRRGRFTPGPLRVETLAAGARTTLDVDLGDEGRWGAATGIALEPDGRGFVLGQRSGERERLLGVRLDCDA